MNRNCRYGHKYLTNDSLERQAPNLKNWMSWFMTWTGDRRIRELTLWVAPRTCVAAIPQNDKSDSLERRATQFLYVMCLVYMQVSRHITYKNSTPMSNARKSTLGVVYWINERTYSRTLLVWGLIIRVVTTRRKQELQSYFDWSRTRYVNIINLAKLKTTR